MKIKKSHVFKFFILLTLFQNFLPILLISNEIQDNIYQVSDSAIPKSSDISGNELFAEQILVHVAGNHSLIQQSYITNDTNIFSRVDFSDPAFVGSSFMIEVSNGILPIMSPQIYSADNLATINVTFESMSGFLFYTNESNIDIVQTRRNRAIEIFKNIFEMDFILLEAIEDEYNGYYYPFFGFTPNWETYFETTVSNLPLDGYWGALDINRITSNSYISSKHLSSSLLFLKNYNYLDTFLKNISNLEIPLNFDLSNLEGEDLFGSLMGSSEESSDIFGEFLLTDMLVENGEQNDQNESLSYLNNLENVLIYSVNYEGSEEGINTIGEDEEFQFDLFKSLNYSNSELHASEKIFNSIDGISLTTLGLGFYSAEVIKTTPEYFEIDEDYINRIESMLFLMDQDIDLSSIKDYSFKIAWRSSETLTNLITIPQNLKNESDPINLLSLLGPTDSGMSIPSSYIEPIQNLVCDYRLLKNEPFLFINKTIDNGNASRILSDDNTPIIIISVENKGNKTAWGQEMDVSALGLSNDPTNEITILDLNMNMFEIMGYDSDRIVEITTTLGYNISELFHDDNPRFFNIDSNDTGTFDLTYPQMDLTSLDLAIIFPYSPEFTQLLIDNEDVYGAIAIAPQLFNTSNSIYNPENWKLEPGQSFSIEISNGLSNISENYEIFDKIKVADLGIFSPVISIGNVLYDSNITGSYYVNDSQTWDIESENLGDVHQIQQYLTFQNLSIIDLENNTLDSINLEMNFTNIINSTSITLEIFDYTIDTSEDDDGFVNIINDYAPQDPKSINFTLSNLYYNLTHFYDDLNNFSIILRITYEDQNSFEMKFDLIQLKFQDLRNERISLNPAHISYSTELGNNQYSSSSNSLSLGIDNGAHLMCISQINATQSYCGKILEYNISITNLGNLKATNISIEMEQPGIIFGLTNITSFQDNSNQYIIAKAGNFSLIRGTLFLDITEILPGETIENLTFNFYSPNSNLLPPIKIQWKDDSFDNYSQKYYNSRSNQIYLPAPIYYLSSQDTPFLHECSIEYVSNFIINAPSIGDNFSVSVEIKNSGLISLYDINIPIDQPFEGLILHNDSKIIWIEKLQPLESRIVEINYTKTSIHGYALPQLSLNDSLESKKLVFQKINDPLVLGFLNLTIRKTFETIDTTTGKTFDVDIIIINNGNIEVGDFTVFDISYDASGFVLYNGTMLKDVEYLAPGEEFSYKYTLKTLNNKGVYRMAPAQIEYFYKYRYVISNEPINFKIREHYLIMTLRLYSPILLGLSSIFIITKYKTHYSREDLEFERREALMFGKSLKEISWHKMNFNEFMEKQVEKLKMEVDFQ